MAKPRNYRAFILDKDDHIVRRHDFEAVDSTAALEIAQQYVNGHDVEVWRHMQIIGRLDRKK
jgi:hypothetical protein